MHVSVHAAKAQLSKLLDLVEDGEEIVIKRHEKAPSLAAINAFSSAGKELLGGCSNTGVT